MLVEETCKVGSQGNSRNRLGPVSYQITTAFWTLISTQFYIFTTPFFKYKNNAFFLDYILVTLQQRAIFTFLICTAQMDNVWVFSDTTAFFYSPLLYFCFYCEQVGLEKKRHKILETEWSQPWLGSNYVDSLL